MTVGRNRNAGSARVVAAAAVVFTSGLEPGHWSSDGHRAGLRAARRSCQRRDGRAGPAQLAIAGPCEEVEASLRSHSLPVGASARLLVQRGRRAHGRPDDHSTSDPKRLLANPEWQPGSHIYARRSDGAINGKCIGFASSGHVDPEPSLIGVPPKNREILDSAELRKI